MRLISHQHLSKTGTFYLLKPFIPAADAGGAG
jgi:hypothetical protein